MQLSFHGAARTVTGSKHLLTLHNGKKLLVDCGMFQGMGQQTDELNRSFGFNPADVNYLVLTHAHIDHSGLIPKLYKEGFRGSIFCTPATKDLAHILLIDSAEIQREDTKYINRKRTKKGLPLFEPMFSVEDARGCIELMKPVEYYNWFKIDADIQLKFTDAGHIIGSAAASLVITENGEKTAITFSGDVGRYNDAILRAPDNFPPADYVILESTYGDKLHEEVGDSRETLLKWINKTCVEQKGKLIIPAFSVGRTQELLYALNQLENENKLPTVKCFVDSPLSQEATEVIKSHPENFNAAVQQVLKSDTNIFDFKGLTYVQSVDESKKINYYNEPCIIISSSGMADAGRVKHHIKNNITDPKNTILMAGYASPSSLAGKLLSGRKVVDIYGDELPVAAQIAGMKSMSAHGDYDDLLQFISCQEPQKVKKIFLVHGEYDVQKEFAKKLKEKGFEVEIPGMNYAFDLNINTRVTS